MTSVKGIIEIVEDNYIHTIIEGRDEKALYLTLTDIYLEMGERETVIIEKLKALKNRALGKINK